MQPGWEGGIISLKMFTSREELIVPFLIYARLSCDRCYFYHYR